MVVARSSYPKQAEALPEKGQRLRFLYLFFRQRIFFQRFFTCSVKQHTQIVPAAIEYSVDRDHRFSGMVKNQIVLAYKEPLFSYYSDMDESSIPLSAKSSS